MYIEAKVLDASSANFAMMLFRNSGDTIRGYLQSANGAPLLSFNNNGSVAPSGSWSTSAFKKMAGAYALNDSAASFNGSVVATDTSCSPNFSSVDRLKIGQGFPNIGQYVKSIAYWPSRLANAKLQALAAA
jgi:hypothetical protein